MYSCFVQCAFTISIDTRRVSTVAYDIFQRVIASNIPVCGFCLCFSHDNQPHSSLITLSVFLSPRRRTERSGHKYSNPRTTACSRHYYSYSCFFCRYAPVVTRACGLRVRQFQRPQNRSMLNNIFIIINDSVAGTPPQFNVQSL